MSIEVTFCLNIGEDVCIDEDEINARFDAYLPSLLTDEDYIGNIIINSPGQPVIRIEDELWAIVQNLCFLSIPNLLLGKSVDILYYSYNGHLRLEPDGNEVVISGDYIPVVKVARQELVNALYSCGHRFVEFFRRLKGSNPNFSATIEHLEKQEEIAKQALETK